MNRRLILFTVLWPLLSLSAASMAQAQALPLSADVVQLTASTADPAPGQAVTITAQSYNIDINSAKLSWTVNGKVVQSGIGATTLDVIAPPIGKTSAVEVTAVTPDGASYGSSLTVTPGSVDMILEPDGYAPPLFPGKVPLAYQNTVKIVAIPHLAAPAGGQYSPSSLVYTWKEDGQVLQDQSGYDKQSLELAGATVPRPHDITVTVASEDGSMQTMGEVNVAPQAPSVAFYVNDPLYGVLFNRAIGSSIAIGSQKETGVLEVPYGFDQADKGVGDLTLSWLINGSEHPELAADDSLTLRAPDSGSGYSTIELDLQNPDDILQGAKGDFSVTFNMQGQTAASNQTTF